MQEKVAILEPEAVFVGLKISRETNKFKFAKFQINAGSPQSIVLGYSLQEYVTEFNYHGNVVDTLGGTDIDLKVRMV